ncbi:MAG: recombinase family protein [Candidatus Thermoplasmatota archaeon]
MSHYRVAIYTRTIPTDKNKDYTQEKQQKLLKQWSEEMGWKWVKVYSEDDNRDHNLSRYQEMLTDSKNGLFNGICIIDTKRITNNPGEIIHLLDDLLRYNVRIHIYDLQHVDIYSEKGRFIINNLDLFEEFCKGRLSITIKSGIKQKMKKEWFGQPPYGYTTISDNTQDSKVNTRLVEDPEEQSIIEEIKRLRSSGKSYAEIASYLNEKQIPTRLKREGHNCSWYPATVRNILLRQKIDTK